MTSCIRIKPQKAIELSQFVLDNTIKISRFKGAIKNKLLCQIKGWVHSLECPVIEASFIVMVTS